jgi:hypothetical protein
MVVFGSACFQFSAKIILELILLELHLSNLYDTDIKAYLLMNL